MKTNKIIWLIVGLLIISACSENYLDKYPLGELSDASFWLTESDLEYAVNAVYMPFATANAGVSHSWILMANAPAGDMIPTMNTDFINVNNLEFYPTNRWINYIWYVCYDGISRANRVIDRAPVMEVDESFKKQKIAEAKFLRGFYYLNLVRAYDDVPLIIEEQGPSSELYPARTPKSEVLAHIIIDLEDAAADLPLEWDDDANVGRATKGSALGYMALTNLYQEEWTEAISNTEELIALSKYDLLPEYSDVYKYGSENHIESLFEAQFRADVDLEYPGWGGNRGSLLQTRTAPAGIGTEYIPWGGWGVYIPSTEILDAFEPGDLRRNQIIAPDESFTFIQGNTYTMTAEATATGLALTKYWYGQNTSGSVYDRTNVIMLKYSEALLNYAEALAHANRIPDAYVQINKIRTRAGLPDKAAAGSVEECITDINKERRVENLFEQNFWYDLTRTKQAAWFLLEYHNKTLSDHKYLFPLPQAELDVNPSLVQNPGY